MYLETNSRLSFIMNKYLGRSNSSVQRFFRSQSSLVTRPVGLEKYSTLTTISPSTPSPLPPSSIITPSPPIQPVSSLRRVVNLLVIDSSGLISERKVPITQLKAESHLHMRELLVVEQPGSTTVARILPRRHCIVLTIGPIRALLFHDRVYLFEGIHPVEQKAAREYAASLASHLAGNLNTSTNNNLTNGSNGSSSNSSSNGSGNLGTSDSSPFELIALEHALLTQTMKQSKRIAYSKRLVDILLSRMGTISSDDGTISSLFPLATTLSHYEVSSKGICECVRELLDDDRDLREACLSEKRRNEANGSLDDDAVLEISNDGITQLELMLESVYHTAAEINMQTMELGRSIRTKQELLELQQSNYRNFILSASLRMSVISVALTSATFVTSAFGQNLSSGLMLEGTPGLLFVMTASSGALGYWVYNQMNRFVQSGSPTAAAARRLHTLQDFLSEVDSKVDAAKLSFAAVGQEKAAAAQAKVIAAAAAESTNFSKTVSSLKSSVLLPTYNESKGGFFDGIFTSSSLSSSSSSTAAAATARRLISKAEFKIVHERTSGVKITDDEVDYLFDLFDADFDGRIGVEEVQFGSSLASHQVVESKDDR
jgi:hypothetical protein